MQLGICQSCGGVATSTCSVCGATICVKCTSKIGCKVCHGRKEIK